MKTPEVCIEEGRREKVRVAKLNGLDYIEVTGDQRQTLEVYFLGKAPQKPITKQNVRIEGGRRVRDVAVIDVDIHRDPNPRHDDWMVVTVDKTGDFSPYTLRLVETDERGHPIIDEDASGRESFRPLHGFDPRYAELEFSFKANCPSDLDCKTGAICPPEKRNEPEISYLAKDYASFRQLILDRLALIMPDWRERHVPDIGIALVEVLAYVGDYLSYYQDAVGTEAYLDTARERLSVRRHARLVDYQMHEGCNARAWVFVWIAGGNQRFEADQLAFITGYNRAFSGSDGVLTSDEVEKISAGAFEYFEPLMEDGVEEIQFLAAHNEIEIYTWDDRQCCLPRGSTSATLLDKWVPAPMPEKKDNEKEYGSEKQYPEHCPPPPPEPEPPTRLLDLNAGDFVLLEEVIGPKTGNPADKDTARRHVVRLTRVTQIEDSLNELTLDGYAKKFPTPLVEIEWAPEDALPFPLCLSGIGPADGEKPCRMIENISVARGNVILVDHGRTVEEAPLGPVPTESSEVTCDGEGRPSETTITPGKFRPRLQRSPLVFAGPLANDAPASARLPQDPRKALPSVTLETTEPEPGDVWLPRPDLLSSDGDAPHFVVEIDDEGLANLRFGDGETGAMPEAGTKFCATYRVGGGLAGNVGIETISCVVLRGGLTTLSGIKLTARNPLPATGGTAPEPIAEVKLFAPRAFRKVLQRAITAADYAAIAVREFPGQVQRAGAELRWTGGWHSVRVAIDPRGALEASPALLEKIASRLHLYRRIGHDLQVVPANYVPLDVAMTICVGPHYLRGHVEAALLDVFQSGLRSDGQPGFFHPDKLSFGDAIHLSRLIMTAQAVEGVESVCVTKLERLYEGANHEIECGTLPIGSLEVARLDNDRNNPENGMLKLELKGGR
jgi:hypothetical protein